MKIVAPITTKNSRFAGGADMGSSHIKIHGKEHTFLQPGEPPIELVIGEKFTDDVIDQAFKSAQKQGVRTPEEFTEYNQGLRKDRRYKTYGDYVLKLSKNSWGQHEKELTSNAKNLTTGGRRMPAEKVRTLKQNVEVIKSTKVAIDSELLYLASADTYAEVLKVAGEEGLKNFRLAERETYKNFLTSDTAKILFPGAFRGEVHLDEKGAMHAQIYSTFYSTKKVKRGKDVYPKTSWARRKIFQEALETYAEKTGLDLNRAYAAWSLARAEVREEAKEAGGKQGLKSADARFREKYKSLKDEKLRVSADDRKQSCEGLLWFFQRMELLKVAQPVFQKHGFDYQKFTRYATSGVEKSGKEYQRERESQLEGLRLRKGEDQLRAEKRALEEDQLEFKARVVAFDAEKEKKAAEALQKRKEELEKANSEELERKKAELEKNQQSKLGALLAKAKTKFKALGFNAEEEAEEQEQDAFGGLVKLFTGVASWLEAKTKKTLKLERYWTRKVEQVKTVDKRLEDAKRVLSAVTDYQGEKLREDANRAQEALRSSKRALEQSDPEDDDLEL